MLWLTLLVEYMGCLKSNFGGQLKIVLIFWGLLFCYSPFFAL